jgi:hypothetical protein
VARDWVDISALKVIINGQATLKSATAPVAMATAAQTGTSIKNRSKAAAPPAKDEIAIKGIRSFRLARGPPM